MVDAAAVGPGGSARIGIVAATDDHGEAMASFFRAVWTPSASAASVRSARAQAARQNPLQAGTPPPTWLALRGDQAIGYVTTIPVRLWNGSTEFPAHWLKGLMVLPEFRNGPVGHALLKTAAAQLPCSGGLAVAAPARRLFTALGYSDLGPIPNLVRPLNVGRVLASAAPGAEPANQARLTGAVVRLARLPLLRAALGRPASGVLNAAAAWSRLGSPGEVCSVAAPDGLTTEIDALWSSARQRMGNCVVRDSRYLTGRYPVGDASPYQWITTRHRGRLAGVAVLRRPGHDGHPRLAGVRLATLVDLLFDPADPATVPRLLGAVEAEARRVGADAVLASASSPALRRVLRRQWYFSIGGNVHLLFRDTTDEGRYGHALDEWWITRGDGNADDAL